MAVAADTQIHNPEIYIPVDTIPAVAAAREVVRQSAWQLVGHRQEVLDRVGEEALPVRVSALSTAEGALQAKRDHGEESEEYQDRFAGLVLDCQRLVAEWYRKNKPEHFPSIRQLFDPSTEDYFSHGLSLRQLTENSLRPMDDDPEEVDRRVNERVEEATPQILKKVGGFVLSQVGLRTISECSDKAIADYQADRHAGTTATRGYNGYVPEIEKLMIRDMYFDEMTGDRFEEQIGLPGTYINHWVIQEALRIRGVAHAKELDKTRLHGTQLLVKDDLMDFVQLLDEIAGENLAANFFMGEVVAPDFVKDYAGFRVEARRRQAELRNFARGVALYVMDLAEDEVDQNEAPAMVEEIVKLGLLNLARENPEVAATIFNEEVARGMEQVAYLDAAGFARAADNLMEKLIEIAPGGGYCGAGGSCGLELVRNGSGEAKKLKDKLDYDAKDVIKDTERRCRKCTAPKGTVYYNLKKGEKGCSDCGATAKY